MDKQTYREILNQLNFTPRGSALMLQVLKDLTLVATATLALWSKTVPGYLIAQLLLACLYFRAFTMMHDAVHRAVTKRRALNDWVGVIYGGLCFLPFTTWRSIHEDHHSWVGNFEKDPVAKMVREFDGKSAFHKMADTLLWRSWLPYVAFCQEAVFWTVSAKLILQKNSYQDKRSELVASVAAPLLVAGSVLISGHAMGAWWLLLPSVVIYLVLVEIINFPHHLRLPRMNGLGKLNLWNQHKVSRTCIYSRWFSSFVLLNFNYHAEHHMFPTLPWYELPKAYALVRAREPEGYYFCEGIEWIRLNRQKSLQVVFAPTETLESDFESGRKAA